MPSLRVLHTVRRERHDGYVQAVWLCQTTEGDEMSRAAQILIVILVVLLLFGVPGAPWGVAHGYGYWPVGGVGALIILILVLALIGIL